MHTPGTPEVPPDWIDSMPKIGPHYHLERGVRPEALLRMVGDGIEMAFCSAERKRELRQRLEGYARA